MRLASRGLRDLNDGPEEITDDMELEAVRAQAEQIRRRALVVAVVGSGLLLLLP